MTKQADLIAYLFEGLQDRSDAGQHRFDVAFSSELRQWMEASSRFTAFVETYRDKIRKKIRVTRDPESALDLRAELEVAYYLLNDRRLAVAYELYASAKTRGPDFSVTYRANLVFNIEVARLRVEETGAAGTASGPSAPLDAAGTASRPTAPLDAAGTASRPTAPLDAAVGIDLARKEEHIVRILLDKLGQMQPGMPNLLVIHTRQDLARSIDLNRLMQAVKTRVEGRDQAFYAANRYTSPAAFYKDFLRLSGILLWTSAPQASPANQLWVNKQARPALDEKVLRVVAQIK